MLKGSVCGLCSQLGALPVQSPHCPPFLPGSLLASVPRLCGVLDLPASPLLILTTPKGSQASWVALLHGAQTWSQTGREPAGLWVRCSQLSSGDKESHSQRNGLTLFYSPFHVFSLIPVLLCVRIIILLSEDVINMRNVWSYHTGSQLCLAISYFFPLKMTEQHF